MKIILIISVSIIMIFFFEACTIIRVEQFENQDTNGFDFFSSDIDNPKYDKYKIDNIFSIIRILNRGDSYEIHMKFASPTIRKNIFLEYIILENKKINIKREINIRSKGLGDYFITSLSRRDIEKLLTITKKELHALVKKKHFNIIIYFKIADKIRHIKIDMIRHKVTKIIWVT